MTNDERRKRLEGLFGAKQFDVEHALSMYSQSFVAVPAFAIYEDEMLKPMAEQIRKCHIYLVGILPKVEIADMKLQSDHLVMGFEVVGNRHELSIPVPSGVTLSGSVETGPILTDTAGRSFAPDEQKLIAKLRSKLGIFKFEILYIGQAFGEDGSRSALDRLKKHETLQKIAIQGTPPGYALNILMLQIVPDNRMIMSFNPFAKDQNDSDQRIKNGLDKLFDTNEAERTTLYEASLIRYFQPRFNKEFKNSFPSTNMKVLKDCYEKDVAAIIAEINDAEIPYQLFSETVPPKPYHTAQFNLHTAEDRKFFFSG